MLVSFFELVQFTRKLCFIINNCNYIKKKIRFTNLKYRYCVRPNASTVAPGEKLDVQIILQGLKKEPEADFKCRDKFLVVSLPCPYELNETTTTVAQLWPTLEKQFKAESSSKKIRVIFKTQAANSVSGAGAAAAGAGAAAAGGAAIAAGKSRKPDAATPISKKVSTNGLSVPDDTLNDSIYSSTSSPAKQHAPAAATSGVDRDLSESQKKIDQLNHKLTSNAAGSEQPAPGTNSTITKESKSAPSNTVASPQSNVPLQVAVIVAILAFILAWLFF